MPQSGEEASEVEESLKYEKDAAVADQGAAEVLQPSVGAFEFPALAISAQLAFVLETAVADVLSVGNDQFYAFAFQPVPERIEDVAPVGNDAPQMGARASAPRPRHCYLPQRALRESAFDNLRRRKLHSGRNAVAVDHHHALLTFPATCFANSGALFFAVMKVASRNISSQSSNRRSSNMDSSFRRAACPTPCSSHIRNRRQQAEPSESRPGTSRHLAPLRRSTQRILSEPARFEAQGRPRPSLRCLSSGNSGHNTFPVLRSTILTASSVSYKKLNK
jgi:hypothetical protein